VISRSKASAIGYCCPLWLCRRTKGKRPSDFLYLGLQFVRPGSRPNLLQSAALGSASYAGKLNFYLSAVDGLMKTERDDPTIGLLLCESHDGAVVEFSFKDVQKTICVSTYTVTREMPKSLEQEVPSIEDLKGVVEKLREELAAVARRSRTRRRERSERTCIARLLQS
jgi:hypothetical protein